MQLEPQLERTCSIACQWGPVWLHEATVKSSQHKEPSAVTVDWTATSEYCVDAPLIACQTDNGGDNPITAPAEFNAYSESCWEDVFADDFRFLTEPRTYASPCPWCGGRLVHNPLCDDLRSDWELSIPFGKYRGRRISQVPKDYLRWIHVTCTNIKSDLRQAIEDQLPRDSRS